MPPFFRGSGKLGAVHEGEHTVADGEKVPEGVLSDDLVVYDKIGSDFP